MIWIAMILAGLALVIAVSVSLRVNRLEDEILQPHDPWTDRGPHTR